MAGFFLLAYSLPEPPKLTDYLTHTGNTPHRPKLPMQVTTRTHDDTASIILDGRFTFQDHRAFRDAYKNLLETPVKTIQVDFAKVDHLDSSALGLLLLAREAASAVGATIELIHCTGMVAKVLEVATFSRLFAIS